MGFAQKGKRPFVIQHTHRKEPLRQVVVVGTYRVPPQAVPIVREAERSILLWCALMSGLNALDQNAAAIESEALQPYIPAPPAAFRFVQTHGDASVLSLPFIPTLKTYYELLLAVRPKLQSFLPLSGAARRAELVVLRHECSYVTSAAQALLAAVRPGIIVDAGEDHGQFMDRLDELLKQIARSAAPCVTNSLIGMPPWAKGRHSQRRTLGVGARISSPTGRYSCFVKDVSETSLGIVTDVDLDMELPVTVAMDNGRRLTGVVKSIREEGVFAVKLDKRLAQSDPLIHG